MTVREGRLQTRSISIALRRFHCQTAQERGTVLRAALERAGKLEGSASAAALADGLAEVPADFVLHFYKDRVQDLRRLDPGDSTGYLAFLDGRKALAALQAEVEKRGLPALDLTALDRLIVDKLMPDLVGREAAARYLPESYRRWLGR